MPWRLGDTHIRAETIVRWAATASIHQRKNRLDIVRAFAVFAATETPEHEVPPKEVFGRPAYRRPRPYIFSNAEILSLLEAARGLKPKASLRPLTYYTLFGLFAATGLRRSEALRLTIDDITDDGLIIRETKYRKNRLVPIHATTRRCASQLSEKATALFPE